MTDTPRTDAEEYYPHDSKYKVCDSTFCRELELELNDAKQHIEELRRAGNEMAAWANGIYQLTYLLSLEQYKQIKRDLKEWEKVNQ
jgi:biotin operon repressor